MGSSTAVLRYSVGRRAQMNMYCKRNLFTQSFLERKEYKKNRIKKTCKIKKGKDTMKVSLEIGNKNDKLYTKLNNKKKRMRFRERERVEKENKKKQQ